MVAIDSGYILVVDPQRHEMPTFPPTRLDFEYPVFVVNSTEQAMGRLDQGFPCLVILIIDDGQDWLWSFIEKLRQITAARAMTIVALTDATSPEWHYSEDMPDVDGFLVKPLSLDILKSLVASATARQTKDRGLAVKQTTLSMVNYSLNPKILGIEQDYISSIAWLQEP
jgi:DNA-binding response OmpR family regulator